MSTITLKQLLDGTQVLAIFLGSLLSIFTFIHFALVKPMKTFLRKEIVSNLVDINKSLQENSQKIDDHIANGGHNHGSSLP